MILTKHGRGLLLFAAPCIVHLYLLFKSGGLFYVGLCQYQSSMNELRVDY